jgi:hypothetical protein
LITTGTAIGFPIECHTVNSGLTRENSFESKTTLVWLCFHDIDLDELIGIFYA